MPFSLPDTLHSASSSHQQAALLVETQIDAFRHNTGERKSEFLALAESANLTCHDLVSIRLRQISPATVIGKGKLAELAQYVQQHCIELVVFSDSLKPDQERNLERILKARVIDRTTLILDIFAQRAQSHAGRLQVELAQLQHLSTRLTRGWTHLERQKGGIGLRGPGESQLETDRRLIGRRMKKLRTALDRLRKQRQLGYKRRQRQAIPLVALVGYTNAGKSTLLNALTGESTMAEDQLFATLDPCMRRWEIGLPESVILADTVGFIQDLPPAIIDAFHATLEGIAQADLLLLVEDHSDPMYLEKRKTVHQLIQTMGADQIPALTVLNKAENQLQKPLPNVSLEHVVDNKKPIVVSALHNIGLDTLKQAVSRTLLNRIDVRQIHLTTEQGALRSQLYQRGLVQREEIGADGSFNIQAFLSAEEYEKLIQTAGSNSERSATGSTDH
ncbi:MAG: GTPase HflX [Gammaproteobacteria bacterium]